MYHPYFKQHLLELGLVVMETRAVSTTGVLVIAEAEEIRREAGVFGAIGDIPVDILEELVTDCWLKALLKFCCKYGVRIVDDLPCIQPQREL